MLVRKFRYACQPLFSCSNLNAARIPRCRIIRCQTVEFPPKTFHLSRSFSTVASTILVQARDPGKLSEELQTALEEHRLNDAWKLHEQHMNMEGFPRKSVVNKVLGTFAQSLEDQWLDRAYDLVIKAINEHKQNLLEKETLIYLALCLARYGLPANATTILRKLVETEQFVPVSAWGAVVGHMSQTCVGAYLAAELVLEIGFIFQDGRVDPRKKSNEHLVAMKPNTTIVNIALAGCLLFEKNRKAERILDMIPRIGVKTDVTMLIMMGHLYERNGRRDELKKLKRYIDEAQELSDSQFREFYNCLLSCHLKFGDLESASHMVLEMLRKAKKAQNSLGMSTFMFDVKKIDKIESQQSLTHDNSTDAQSSRLTYEDFCADPKYSRIEVEAKELLKTLIMRLQTRLELVTTERGILQPTETIFVKLVKAFLQSNKIKELVEFLVKVEKRRFSRFA